MEYFYIGKDKKRLPIEPYFFDHVKENGEEWIYLQNPAKERTKLEKLLSGGKTCTFEDLQEFKDPLGIPESEPVCRYLKKICILESDDEETPNPNLLVEFYDLHGKIRKAVIPLEMLVSINDEPGRLLARKGLDIHTVSKSSRKNLITFLSIDKTKHFGVLLNRIGWFEDTFVLSNENYSKQEPDKLFFLDKDKVHSIENLQSSGTLEEWKKEVASYAKKNHCFIFGLGIAFASPLLKDFGIESGGFNFFGSSSTGKTTSTIVANSVWGSPKWMESWRTTDNALEGICHGHNDAFLGLDELSQTKPDIIAKTAYMIANQSAKSRSNCIGETLEKKRWRILFLSNGEPSIEQKIEASREKARAGQLIRVIDIPIQLDDSLSNKDGEKTAYQNFHGFKSNIEISTHLYQATEKYYGTASKSFLSRYVKLKKRNQVKLRKELISIENSLEEVLKKEYGGVSSQVLRALKRFAIVKLALGLAKRFKILPFEEEEVEQAVHKMLDSWVEYREGVSSGEESAILRRLSHFFNQHGYGASFINYHTKAEDITTSKGNTYGYRKQAGESVLWYIKPVIFKTICQNLKIDYSQTRRVLKSKKLVETESDPTAKDGFRDNVKAYPKSIDVSETKGARFFAVKEDILNI